MSIFSSSVFRRSLGTGGGGSGWVAMGTQPMAAARANGSQAATEAILCGGMFALVHTRPAKSTAITHLNTAAGRTRSTIQRGPDGFHSTRFVQDEHYARERCVATECISRTIRRGAMSDAVALAVDTAAEMRKKGWEIGRDGELFDSQQRLHVRARCAHIYRNRKFKPPSRSRRHCHAVGTSRRYLNST